MYEQNEKLVLLENFGKPDTDKFIPKGTEVEFIKAVDPEDISQSFLVVKYGERVFPIKETFVKPLNDKKIKKAFEEFEKNLMKTNPELRKYHPNIFLRYYYRLYYFIKGFLDARKK